MKTRFDNTSYVVCGGPHRWAQFMTLHDARDYLAIQLLTGWAKPHELKIRVIKRKS